jgi:hypothetical protein
MPLGLAVQLLMTIGLSDLTSLWLSAFLLNFIMVVGLFAQVPYGGWSVCSSSLWF